MQTTLVITVLGPDKPGLVKSLSKTLNQFQGSWTESRMAHLAGKFAGILQVSLPVDQIDALTTALNELQSDSLKIQIEKTVEDTVVKPDKILTLGLLGQDRPGIIHDITQQLGTLNVNIEELESHIKEASMSGEILFSAELKLGLPQGVSTEAVQDILEDMSDQFMIDVMFSSAR
jgi:glycine cleavage system regulatory protein